MFVRFTCLFLIVLFVEFPVHECIKYQENLITDAAVAQKWVTAAADFDKIVFPQKRFVVDFLLNKVPNIPLPTQCSSALISIGHGLKDKKFWAYHFLDSSARGKSGLANGYISDLGNFDQCLNIPRDDRDFGGSYCLVNVGFPLTKPPERNWLRIMKLNLRETELKDTLYEFYGNHTEIFFYESFAFATCIPSSCTVQDLGVLLKHAFPKTELKIEPRGSCTQKTSYIDHYLHKPISTLLFASVIIVLAQVAITSTLITYFDLPGKEYASYFCIIRNTAKLTAESSDPVMQRLQFLDSFKCFFQIGGSFAHIIIMMPAVPLMFAIIQDRSKDMEDLWLLSEYFQKAIYFTQLILVISGFFSAYYLVPLFEKTDGKGISFASYAVKRWLRTTPTTIVSICLLFFTSAVSYGPLAEDFENSWLQTCRKTWFLTVFQVNNLFKTYDTCLPQTWTQAADFQLWLLAYYPLKTLAANPKKGLRLCWGIFGLGIIIPILVTYAYDLPAPIGSTRPLEIMYLIVRGESFPAMNFHTYNCVSNYFIGVIVGYYCLKNYRLPFWLALPLQGPMWGQLFICLFGPYIWQNIFGLGFNAMGNALYFTCMKISWGIFYGSCIYISYFYLDRFPMSEILYSKVFTVFGRLSLSIYVSQLAPICYYLANAYEQMPNGFSYVLFLRCLSIVAQVIAVGYFTFLVAEAPFLNLTKNMSFKGKPSEHMKGA